MLGCNGCQDLMLEYLYDLLEEADQQAFLNHLEGCASCKANLEKVRAQQKLLATAARTQFPDLQFTPPAPSVTPAESQPTPAPKVLPMRRPASRSAGWRRALLAAGILLAVGGLSVPGYHIGKEYIQARRAIVQHEKEVASAKEEVAEVTQQLNKAVKARDEQFAKLQHEMKSRELRLVVSGPRVVQPGAPAEFLVHAYDLNGNPTAAEISARLGREVASTTLPKESKKAGTATTTATAGEKGKKSEEAGESTLSVQTDVKGVYRVRIPVGVKWQPGQAVDMLVSARKVTGFGASDAKESRPVTLEGKVQLTAPVYLTHLTTDKPMYQPGETVFFRSLTLNRSTLQPAQQDFLLRYTLSNSRGMNRVILQGSTHLLRLDGKNQVQNLPGPDGKSVHGIGAGELPLEPGFSGGEYTLTVSEDYGRFSPVSRKFIVNEYRKPRLDKKLDFNRSSYGAGDEVQVKASAKRAEGGLVRNTSVLVTVNVDDVVYAANGLPGAPFRARTDIKGEVTTKFRLPKQIERGQATVSLLFEDGSTPEAIVRPIPVIVKKVQVDFYPEGGDLVAGLATRVYFQARTPLGKPAQIRGTLLEDGKPTPITLATEHDDEQPGVNQGNGAFQFTPRFGRKYAVRIDTPTGITDLKSLPKVEKDGVVLTVPKGVFHPDEPIRAQVHSTRTAPLMVGAYCRGQLLDTVQLAKGQTEVELKPITGTGGVCRITVFEEQKTGRPQRQLRPVAERLIYRHPKERVDISILTDKKQYTPGEKVNLQVITTDEKEKRKPSVLMLGVVDKSVITLADDRTDRSMPTHFLMTTEVRRAEDLEHADFLVGSHPKAAKSLDLLLGTQGWRRFAEQDPARFRERLRRASEVLPEQERERQQADAERLLVMTGQSDAMTTDFDQEKIDKISMEFEETVADLQTRHAEARETLTTRADDEDYRAALAVMGRFDDWFRQGRQLATPVLGALVVLLTILALVVSLRQHPRKALAWGGLAGVCGLLLAITWPSAVPQRNAGATQEAATVAKLQAPIPPRVNMNEDEGMQPEQGAGGKPGDGRLADNAAIAPPPMPMVPGVAPGGFAPGGFGGMNRPGMGFMGGGAMPKGGIQGGFGGGGFAGGGPAVGGVPGAPAAMGFGMGGFGGRGAIPPMGPAPVVMNPEGKALKEAPGLDHFARPMDDRASGKRDERRKLQVLKNYRFLERQQARLKQNFEAHEQAAPGGGGGGRGLRAEMDRLSEPLIVREYAHVRPETKDAVRGDFAETLYWHPVLVTSDGTASVTFPLCDSVTSFQVTAFAHTLDGRLGSATKQIESRLPFTLAQKLPIEVTASDRIDVPLAVSNNTAAPVDVKLGLAAHDGLSVLERGAEQLKIPANGRVREVFRFRPSLIEGQASLTVTGKAGNFSDALRESLRIVPDGFPTTGASSDLLEKSATHRITLPEWIPGTLSCRVDVYPSTLADLQKGLEGLLREPHGCFEQSSTTNYPNVLILDYLRTSDKSDPALEKRTRDLLDRGYQKLTSYECQKPGMSQGRQGYEWFGGSAPPHEALTAYGLLQFRDMAKVYNVDSTMLQRTRDYLLEQRDGKGGFKRNPRALDSFGRAPDHITNAYIVWSLTESGDKADLSKELKALTEKAEQSTDPYFLSLVGISLANQGQRAQAKTLLDKVAKAQKDDGQLNATQTSITGSGGRDLAVETTALAILGWLKTDAVGFHPTIEKSVRWIGQQRAGSGGFGSTQSTILALKSLIAWTTANKRTPEAGTLRLFVGEEKVAELDFPAAVDKPLTLTVPDAEKRLKVGMNKLRVEITGDKNHFPHTLSWSCRTVKPESAANVPVKLSTKFASSTLEEGATARLSVRVENASGKPQGMAVAIVGLPAGLNVPEDLKQLREHCKLPTDGTRPLVDAFEIRGREVILYWRDMAKDRVIDVPLDLIARVPGIYRGPASRAYLYYNADRKHWIEPLSVTIQAK